jgi:hypothetical protein
MGIEYRIVLRTEDFAAFAKDVRGKTLDQVLRDAPGFLDSNGTAYSYNTPENLGNQWLDTIHVQEDGLWLTLYSLDLLLNYMMNAALDICGRLEIEDG